MLPEYAAKMGLSCRNSPLCQCGMETGSIHVEPFLLHCFLHKHARDSHIKNQTGLR